ncbi:uncharacterized protein PV06_06389 [Exophiala oligosperma]|uniref:Uncharacterized protein n=2 Tax=Chaetothyriales TaxID=34395 RepID=A0A0D2E505_9EURO|nr:uncharacterized protein PV06_06389 [Exophiala oligosperma]KAJ9624614.1 hypothetical protein H2204_010796 [Knufia peltigerae]KIW42884.1 hypothetical protein PV06_06389 [Exophiala oligosperma]
MAPGSLSPVYLPDLGRCLAGDLLLPSWDDLLDGLLSHDDIRSSLAVEILSGDRPKKILSQPYPSFPKPSSTSKTAFDTSSAGIKPSSDSLYDVEEIKADALWLSKQVDIDELEAFRLAILEWQYRAESRLQEGYSEAELASLRNALGGAFVDKHFQGLRSQSEDVFNSQDSRRSRLARRFLQEKVTILRLRRELLDTSLMPEAADPSASQLRSLAADLPSAPQESIGDEVESAIAAIRDRLKDLESGRPWGLDESSVLVLRDRSDTSSLETIEVVLEILLLRVRQSNTTVPSVALIHWLELMSSVGFFSTFTSQVSMQLAAIRRIQSLGSFVSAALLNLAATIASLNETATSPQSRHQSRVSGYFHEIESIHEYNEILVNYATLGNVQAGPAILAWAIIVHELWTLGNTIKEARESHHAQKAIEGVSTLDTATGRRSSGSSVSIQQSIFEDLLDRISMGTSQEDPSSPLLDAAIDQCHVFDYVTHLSGSKDAPLSILSAYKLQILQELITVSQSFLGYTPELVSAQLGLLSNTSSEYSKKRPYDPAVDFVEDKFLLAGFYDISAARFPYECLPFLQFSRALAKADIFSDHGLHYVEFRLRNLTTFTQAAVKGVQYKIIREDESDSFVALEKPVNMLDLTQNRMLTYSSRDTTSLSILPADTVGQVISDPDAPVKIIKWDLNYSCLSYIGQLLELRYLKSLQSCLSPLDDQQAVVSESIGLIADLLSSTLRNAAEGEASEDVRQHCIAILEESSTHLQSAGGIESLVFEILEQELQAFRQRSVATFNCDILLSCLDFIIVLSKIQPHIVWSGINRTSLLGRHSSSTYILGIVSAVEVPTRAFSFLAKCAELYQSLVQLTLRSHQYDSSMSGAATSIRRRSMLPTTLRTQTSILSTSTEIMFNAFQEMSEWFFQSAEQRNSISSLILNTFSDIIRYAFDVGQGLNSNTAVTNPFIEPAKFIISSFRDPSFGNAAISPVVRCLVSGRHHQAPSASHVDVSDPHLESALSLATLLIRFGDLEDAQLTSAELHIFNSVPSLLRLLLTRKLSRKHCLRLMRAILTSIERQKPTSLLGHLGSASCIDLLHVIRHIDQESQSSEERSELWKLLTLLVNDSQQWLATVIVTGTAPDGPKRTKQEEIRTRQFRGRTFLSIALEELTNVRNLSQVVAIPMLDFVLEAQQNWSWVTEDVESSSGLVSKLSSFVAQSAWGQSDETELARWTLIAARVTDISNHHLHHARAARNVNDVKAFIPLLEWLTSNAVEVSLYKSSLHANLKKNFSSKYTGLSTLDIKRKGLTEQEYGPNFYYDIDYADKLLAIDPHWRGKKVQSSDQSFTAEFRKANTNLSVVDSELKLLASLQRLCVDHCRSFARERECQKVMARLVQVCLQSNARVYPSESIFDSLFQTRLDLSVALLGELLSAGAKGEEFYELLEPAWDAVRFRNGSYEQAIINNDLLYWRSTLYTLFMAMQFHVRRKIKATTIPGTSNAIIPIASTNTTFLEVTTDIVAKGFESVVGALQDQKLNKNRNSSDDNNIVGPRDVTLLLMLAQAILRLPSLPQFAAEMSSRIVNSGLLSSCLLLYSWSHLLTRPDLDNQPRYADFCVQFLASLSSLPSVAEHLAVEGVLSRLMTSKTTESLQRVPGGLSHVDARPGGAFLYRVWALGMLPLCLNLLHGVGGAIAGEISIFLNQFPNQLARASTSFMLAPQTRAEGTDALTLTVASEAATLALISYILSSYRDAGASAAVDPTTVLPLKGYDEHRKAIAEDIRDVLALKADVRRKMTVPADERESSWQNSSGGDKLDEKVVTELKMALTALGRNDDDDDDK